jgi:hypothetical protein
MTNSEIWMISLTAVIAVAGLIGACIFNNQLGVMQGQLDEMKVAGKQTEKTANAAQEAADVAKQTLIAAQRAWVRPDKIAMTGVLSFNPDGTASATVSFNATNVGNSPAIHVMPYAWLFVLRNGGPIHWQEQQRLCAQIRQGTPGAGSTLFPNESFPKGGIKQWSLGIGATADEIKQGLAASGDGKGVNLFLLGCIDYSFPTDAKTHHQTGFMYQIIKTATVVIRPADGSIPAEQLQLLDTAIGMGEFAD